MRKVLLGLGLLFVAQEIRAQVVEEWVSRYYNPGTGDDWAYDLAVDDSGNVYVTGGSVGFGSGYDFMTLKYDSNRTLLWEKRYNGSGNGEDRAYAIAVDDSGNVYVTGASLGSAGGGNYLTIKYDNSGTLHWTSSYNGPGNSTDEAWAIAVDDSGDVYVTGQSSGSGTFYDYATIKYDGSTGDTLWARRYDGPGNLNDFARDITVDGSGYVYVTGESFGSGTSADYATLKYDNNGNTVWVRRHGLAGVQSATAIAVDNSGNVIVAGDPFTIKYGSSGDTLWETGNAPASRALALDPSGNVYVTGRSWNGFDDDYGTFKYNGATGETLWTRKYNGPGNLGDYSNALALDSAGNVYVTGYSWGSGSAFDYATVKYDNNGSELWVERYDAGNGDDRPNAVAVDLSGNVYVTGASFSSSFNYDYVTLKVDGSGAPLWVERYAGPGLVSGDDIAEAIAVDSFGNVYVTGRSTNSSFYRDYATIKYDGASGEELWLSRYIGFGLINEPSAISVDLAGNVVVTGVSETTSTNADYATIKYDGSTGDTLWVRRYDGPGNLYDAARVLTVDSSGNVLVTGRSWSGTSYDFATIKYNTNGNQQWVRRYDGPANGSDYPYALTIDPSGNVYVAGESWNGMDYDYVTIKYDSSGNTDWERRYVGPANGDDYANAIDVDAFGNVYVTGASDGIGLLYDYLTIKYSSIGDSLWVSRFNGPANNNDEAVDIALDPSGNTYVSGWSSSVTNLDYLTIQYDGTTGDTLWTRRYNGPGSGDDEAYALALDPSGEVYITGRSLGSGTERDYTTIKYDGSTGDSLWVIRYNGPGNWTDEARAMVVDGSGNVYVTGFSTNAASSSWDYATVKYSQPVGVEEPDSGEFRTPYSAFRLFQNLPNPFHRSTTILYSLPAVGARHAVPVQLKVYDITGRLVETLVDKPQMPGIYQLQWDGRIPDSGVASGIYFYRLEFGTFTATRKLTLLR